jgi:RimJ/RimL family protein N-acetyltransferase
MLCLGNGARRQPCIDRLRAEKSENSFMRLNEEKLNPVVLDGREVRLEPLSHSHFEKLCAIGVNDEIWRWMPMIVRNVEELRLWLENALEDQRKGIALPWTIVERSTGLVVGSTRFANIDLTNRRVEIGWTWIGPRWQRTRVNTETKYLMLRHAFESLGCVRVELKTDALNERSRKAVLRIGAKEEGTLRRHMITSSGRIRDTVYFSILDSEWPQVKAVLQARLAPIV